VLTNVDCRAGYKRKLKYFPFQGLPILRFLRIAHACALFVNQIPNAGC
jgi:hypothetical protein